MEVEEDGNVNTMGLTKAGRKCSTSINVLGLCAVSSETVKLMKETSLTGHYVLRVVDGGAAVNVNAYPGTKHAMTAITEVLQMEMRHAG